MEQKINRITEVEANHVKPHLHKTPCCVQPFSVRSDAVSELYNMSCIDGMKHYPDNYFDLAICDPPYGIGLVKTENGSWGIRKQEQKETASKTFDCDFSKPTLEYIVELFRVSKNQILFGANHYIEVVPYNTPCWLLS